MTDSVRTLIHDDPAQAASVARLVGLMDDKMAELRAAIAARDGTGGLQAGVAAVRASTERATMDAIRRVIGEITHAEMALLAVQNEGVEADERRAQVIAVLVGLASIVTRIGVEWLLARRERTSAAPVAVQPIPTQT